MIFGFTFSILRILQVSAVCIMLVFWCKSSYIHISNNEWNNHISTNTVIIHDNSHCFQNTTNYIFPNPLYCTKHTNATNATNFNDNVVIDENDTTKSRIYNTLFGILSFLSPLIFSVITYGIVLPVAIVMVFDVVFPASTNKGDTGNKEKSGISDMLMPKPIITVHTNDEIFERLDSFVGCENIKKEIQKVIDYVKYENVYKFHRCRLLKGILLIGPSGCGKTHLVRTIAGESGMNFITKNGSDFVEIFVGSGPRHIKELFKVARERKPCLIFIDEADALIQKRYGNNSLKNSHGENRNTTCKLLEEMDAMIGETGILVIFATNMPKTEIDKAVMRAGRVDLTLHINQPIFEERIELFKLYLGKFGFDIEKSQIDFGFLARISYGMTGADIKLISSKLLNNVVNSVVKTKFDANGKYIVDEKNIVTIHGNGVVQVNLVETEIIDEELKKLLIGSPPTHFDIQPLTFAENDDVTFSITKHDSGGMITKQLVVEKTGKHDTITMKFQTGYDIEIAKYGNAFNIFVDKQLSTNANPNKHITVTLDFKKMESKIDCGKEVSNDKFIQFVEKYGYFAICKTTLISIYNKFFKKQNMMDAMLFNNILEKLNGKTHVNFKETTFYTQSSPQTKFTITTQDIDKEIEKHKLGIERHQKINELNKTIIAFHESGHAIMSFLLKDSILPTKACINLGAEHLGVTMYDGDDEDVLLKSSVKQLMIDVVVLFSGRSCEKLFVGEITAGAENDYQRARNILLRMVMHGMLHNKYNYVGNEDKVPTHVENILMKMNAIIITWLEGLLKTHEDIVKVVATKLIVDGNISGDEIKKVFADCGKEQFIQHYEIAELVAKLQKVFETTKDDDSRSIGSDDGRFVRVHS